MNLKKVLVVEENEKKREHLSSFLSSLNFETTAVPSLGEKSLDLLKKNNFCLFLAHLSLLDDACLKSVKRLRNEFSDLGVILLCEKANAEQTIPLLKQGLIDYIAPPDNFASIFSAIKNELNKRELIKKNEYYLQNLRKLRSEQTRNIRRALELEEIYDTTLENLMTALDLRDVETFGHSQTVAKYCQVLGEILGIKEKHRLDNIRKGALLHDVGKIAIPDSILKKPNRLSTEEWEKIKLHPALGFGFIKEIKLVKEVGNIILHHHERFDGTGYPNQLEREEIPLEARIFGLADALDAITSHRPYRKERDFKTAKKEIQDHCGTQFDPWVVEAFCSLDLEKWEKIRYETTKLLPCLF